MSQFYQLDEDERLDLLAFDHAQQEEKYVILQQMNELAAKNPFAAMMMLGFMKA